MVKTTIEKTLLLIFLLVPQLAIGADKLYSIDFTQQENGDAKQWLASRGFEFLLDADDLSLTFNDGKLQIETTEDIAGLVGIKFDTAGHLNNIGKVVIEWSVERFPQGADWENGSNRLAIGFIFVLGTEKLSSGLPFGINAAPYFLGPFIGEKEPVNKRYLGALYKAGGRYYCVANKDSALPVVTDFDIDKMFNKEFNKPTPPLTAFAFQMNTNDTRGGAKASIKRITFFSR